MCRFLFLVVAVLTKLFVFLQVQTFNQLFAIKNIIPHSREYHIVYFSFSSRCFPFTFSKRLCLNQHILLELFDQEIKSMGLIRSADS